MKILAVNGLASLQDVGRFGQRKFGIGINGAMDSWSLKAGNLLLTNPENTVAIEITLGGLTVQFEEDTMFCLTGAVFEAYLTNSSGEKVRVHHNWRVVAHAGDTLELVRAVYGMHGYLCVRGGFAIPPVLGSASTNLKAEFGGYQGRLLQVGDTLAINAVTHLLSSSSSPWLPVIGMASIDQFAVADQLTVVRIIKNSEYDAFTPTAHQRMSNQHWQLSSNSNRMGYRFDSGNDAKLELVEPLQMNSHGVDIGMIQVPPQGQPIVLMADTQTTGGYPKIASVIEADIGKLSQIRFGRYCQFVWVTLAQAIQARQARDYQLSLIRNYANAHV